MAQSYPIISTDGSVTSWGSTNFYSDLLSRISPNTSTFNITAQPFDTTAIGSTTTNHIGGLRSVSGTLSGRVNLKSGASHIPSIGNNGLVTFASGYADHVKSWSLTLETVAVHDITSQNATPPTYASYRPDRIRATGTYTALVDATDDLIYVPAPNALGAAIDLKYGENTADELIEFDAVVTQLSTTMATPSLNQVVYGFVASTAITPSGTNSILGSSALTVPLWTWSSGSSVPNLLTLTAITGKTYIVDAFWTRISLDCSVDSLVEVSIDWQGAGAISGSSTGLS